jgi:hypothetical protein
VALNICEPYGHAVMTAAGTCSRCGLSFVSGPEQGAPRQAGTEQQVQEAEQARRELAGLGIDTSVRQLTPASAGHAVRLLIADGPTGAVTYLEPQQAADLAHQLLAEAQEAIYADRAVRRG